MILSDSQKVHSLKYVIHSRVNSNRVLQLSHQVYNDNQTKTEPHNFSGLSIH